MHKALSPGSGAEHLLLLWCSYVSAGEMEAILGAAASSKALGSAIVKLLQSRLEMKRRDPLAMVTRLTAIWSLDMPQCDQESELDKAVKRCPWVGGSFERLIGFNPDLFPSIKLASGSLILDLAALTYGLFSKPRTTDSNDQEEARTPDITVGWLLPDYKPLTLRQSDSSWGRVHGLRSLGPSAVCGVVLLVGALYGITVLQPVAEGSKIIVHSDCTITCLGEDGREVMYHFGLLTPDGFDLSSQWEPTNK